VVLEKASLAEPKTKQLALHLARLGWSSALLIDGPEGDRNFELAARNLIGLQLLPPDGANVYDILKRDVLVLTRDAVRALEERLA
jgi:large subunit ribosomal protein L4